MPTIENHHLGHDDSPIPDAFYRRVNHERLCSTLHAQGAWQPGEQHLAPASALVLAEIERRLPSDKLISRISYDVLGVIHSGEFVIEVEVIRPGRTIELVEGIMRHGDRISIRARVWRLAYHDTEAIQGSEWAPLPSPDSMNEFHFADSWGGGFLQSLTARQEAGSRPGHARSWLHTTLPLVTAEDDPPTAVFVKLVDTANGLAVREDPATAFFANVDLSIHLLRQPVPGWVGFDTRVSFGATGLGETHSVLSDQHGPIGTACQSLTVRHGR